MKLIAALVMLLALSACSLPVFFRVPIVQGNIVTADQVAKLKTGMSKKQVAYVLGTPLIKSPFEANRWDYVFYYRNPRAHVRKSKLDLYFVDGKLSDIEGNEEYNAQIDKSGDQNQLSGNNAAGRSSVGTSSALTGNQNGMANGARSDNRNGQTPNSDNLPGSNQPVTTQKQPTPKQPLPHKGPPLPGEPDQGL